MKKMKLEAIFDAFVSLMVPHELKATARQLYLTGIQEDEAKVLHLYDVIVDIIQR